MPRYSDFNNNFSNSDNFGNSKKEFDENVGKIVREPKYSLNELKAIIKEASGSDGMKLKGVPESAYSERLKVSNDLYKKILYKHGDVKFTNHKPFTVIGDNRARFAKGLVMKPGDDPQTIEENDRNIDRIFGDSKAPDTISVYLETAERISGMNPAKIVAEAGEAPDLDKYITEHIDEINEISYFNGEQENLNEHVLPVVTHPENYSPELRERVANYQKSVAEWTSIGPMFAYLEARAGVISNPYYARIDTDNVQFYTTCFEKGGYSDKLDGKSDNAPELGSRNCMENILLENGTTAVNQLYSGEVNTALSIFTNNGIPMEDIVITYKKNGRTVTEPFNKEQFKDMFCKLDGKDYTLSDKDNTYTVNLKSELRPNLMLKTAKASVGELEARPEKPKQPGLWKRIAHFFSSSAYKNEFDVYERKLRDYNNYENDVKNVKAHNDGMMKQFDKQKDAQLAAERAQAEKERAALEEQKRIEAERARNPVVYAKEKEAIAALKDTSLPCSARREAALDLISAGLLKDKVVSKEAFDAFRSDLGKKEFVGELTDKTIKAWTDGMIKSKKPLAFAQKIVDYAVSAQKEIDDEKALANKENSAENEAIEKPVNTEEPAVQEKTFQGP